MRTIFAIAIMLVAAPAFAADAAAPAANPAAPPAPPAVTYQVWGFQWNGGQWVKQPDRVLQTTDLKQAADYKSQIDGYAGWKAATNLPQACYVHTRYQGQTARRTRPAQLPDKPTYAVWAFQNNGDKWVKNDQYSWTTADPLSGLNYAKQLDAVAGWTATTNCPPPVPQAQRFVNGGMVQGAPTRQAMAGGAMTFNLGGASITVPNWMLQRAGIGFGGINGINVGGINLGGLGAAGDSGYSSSDNWPNYSDTSQVDQSNALQDMLNQQQNFNNMEDMINQQNFDNTEQMINDEQNNLNAQGIP